MADVGQRELNVPVLVVAPTQRCLPNIQSTDSDGRERRGAADISIGLLLADVRQSFPVAAPLFVALEMHRETAHADAVRLDPSVK